MKKTAGSRYRNVREKTAAARSSRKEPALF